MKHVITLALAVTLIPKGAIPLTCKTHTTHFGCKICKTTECTDGERTWGDTLMRCDDEPCKKPKIPAPTLPAFQSEDEESDTI